MTVLTLDHGQMSFVSSYLSFPHMILVIISKGVALLTLLQQEQQFVPQFTPQYISE